MNIHSPKSLLQCSGDASIAHKKPQPFNHEIMIDSQEVVVIILRGPCPLHSISVITSYLPTATRKLTLRVSVQCVCIAIHHLSQVDLCVHHHNQDVRLFHHHRDLSLASPL